MPSDADATMAAEQDLARQPLPGKPGELEHSHHATTSSGAKNSTATKATIKRPPKL